MTDLFVSENRPSAVYVVSGPSGAGKTSLCDEALRRIHGLHASVSHTTRPPRLDEEEGKDYFFVDRETFDGMIERGEFMEWAEVHGQRYGTSTEVVKKLSKQGPILFEVDCKGARGIRKQLPEAVLIFVMTPSFFDLVSRIKRRGRMPPAELSVRIRTAKEEIRQIDFFDYVVVNDVFSEASKRLQAILVGQGCTRERIVPEWLGRWNEEIRRYEDSDPLPESA